MQIIVDIPDEQYNDIIEHYNTFPNEWKKQGLQAIKNGTPLPKEATNGDVIKAVTGEDFSRGASFYNHDLMICDGEDYLAFNIDWWNAPYIEADRSEEHE